MIVFLSCGHGFVASPTPYMHDIVWCVRCQSYCDVTHTLRKLAREYGMLYREACQRVKDTLATGKVPTKMSLLDAAKVTDLSQDEVSMTRGGAGRKGTDWANSDYAPILTETHANGTVKVFQFAKNKWNEDTVKDLKSAFRNTARALGIGVRMRDEVEDGVLRFAVHGADRKSYELSEEGRESRRRALAARAAERKAAKAS